MQKFTVFAILLSLSVVLVLGDILLNNYLKTSVLSAEIPAEVLIVEQELPVELETEDLAVESPESQLALNNLEAAGFFSPVLKEALFSGLLFQFIPLDSPTDLISSQWSIFDGENYVGSIYELAYSSETGALQGYFAIRNLAQGLTELGTVNEVNLYGEGSFYFNHKIKNQTVFIVIRSGSTVYGFEYPYTFHENMKKLFDFL
jgi:hypothetical protein